MDGGMRAGAASPVELTTRSDGPPIACTLDGDDVDARIAAWRRMLDAAVARTPVGVAGMRIDFAAADVDLEALTALVAAELACCAFFTFDINLTPTTVSLEVTAPDDAAPIVQELFGP